MIKKRYFLKYIVISLSYIIIFSVKSQGFAAMYAPSLSWKTVNTPHFSIHYYKGEEEVVQKLIPLVEEVYDDLTQRFQRHPWGRTDVIVADSYDQANGLTEIMPYNQIVLRVVPPAADSVLADYDNWMKLLFTHEYTHVLHLTDTEYPAKLLKFVFGKIIAPNGLTPGWVIEGLPTYFETKEGHGGRGHASYTEMLLRTDILNHQFLKIDQMAGSQYDWPSWSAQYLYGVGFWEYLADVYGERQLVQFSHKMGASLWFFSLNNKAKRVFKDEQGNGKSFYTLWKDWKAFLETKYGALQGQLSQEGLKEGEPYLVPQKGESFSLPTFSSDRKYLAYIAASVDHRTELRLRNLSTGKEKILLRKKDVQQMSFSPDGKSLVYCTQDTYKVYATYSDLYEIDLETSKSRKLTEGKRARDPDVSPDGKSILAVVQKTAAATLALYDRTSKEWKEIVTVDQMSSPRWIDDENAVVMMHQAQEGRGRWNLFSVNITTGKVKKLTHEGIVESRPAVDRDRQRVYFTSDKNGIFNLYAYDLNAGKEQKITNVVSGAFAPTVSSDGDVVFQYYTGKGYELRALRDTLSDTRLDSPAEDQDLERPAAYSRDLDVKESFSNLSIPGEKKYSPWKRLLVPRAILPNAAFLDGTLFLSGTVINHDPLYRHYWFADVNYRSDNRFVGYGAGYIYNRLTTPISLSFADYSVNYGNIYGAGFDYFEERRRGAVGVSYPWHSNRLALNYFFENRTTQSGLPVGATAPSLGRYAGLLAQYSYRNTCTTGAGISAESGTKLYANFETTNHVFGASEGLEQYVVWGDARTYIKMPYSKHHVIALRGAGGAAFGDQLFQGNFGLGGAIGESPFTGTTTRLFTLRGLPLSTFSRDRAWVASIEYRFPLVSIQRGLGTWPLAVNQAHFAFFADMGDALRRGQTQFKPLLGLGAELRADFILSWHLPVTGRLGYGVIVTNRDRIAGVKDTLTGADARNGVVIVELGTSF